MYIYQITNLINGKIYIGQTNNIQKRWANHKCSNDPNMVIARAFRKYGVDNFKRETLYVFDTSAEALAKEAELVTAEFVRASNNYNSSLGGEQPINPGKKIYRFNFQGDLIETFDNANIAAEAVYRNVSSIHAAI